MNRKPLKSFSYFSFLWFLLSCSCTTTHLAIHTKVSDLNLPNQNEEVLSLSEMIASSQAKGVVLFFYPKDDSPLCTEQARLITEALPEFAKYHYLVLGVSQDSPESHKKFMEKYQLNFPLLSDESGEAHKALGIGRFFNMPSRTTIILDKNLEIEYPAFVHNTSAAAHIKYALSHIMESNNGEDNP